LVQSSEAVRCRTMAKVQVLWSAGFRFWSYRSHPDAEPLPERLRDVDDFIRRNLRHSMRIAG
ncbi:hypothetical protein ABTK03_20215, partial [Acinetobacter baumannii]